MKLVFDWNESKNLANFKKHGIWFEEAKTVWADEYALEFFDDEHSESTIRIISARPVTKHEKEQYEEGI